MATTTFHKVKAYEADILSSWTYSPPYDFYNQNVTEDNKEEWLTGNYYCVYSGEELIGFFCHGESARVPVEKPYLYADDCLDLGLGMRPDLTGKGLGSAFLASILKELDCHFPNTSTRLTVATFNKRAIHLYEQFGFIIQHHFHGKNASFYIMVRKK